MSDITIYTKSGCPYCAAAKNDLRTRGEKYTEFDVLKDGARLEEMLTLNGNQRRVPTIVRDGSVSVGFNGS